MGKKKRLVKGRNQPITHEKQVGKLIEGRGWWTWGKRLNGGKKMGEGEGKRGKIWWGRKDGRKGKGQTRFFWGKPEIRIEKKKAGQQVFRRKEKGTPTPECARGGGGGVSIKRHQEKIRQRSKGS